MGKVSFCNFLSRVVSMNETWVHFYEPETKQQPMVWRFFGFPVPKKFRVEKFADTVFASVFFLGLPGGCNCISGIRITVRRYSRNKNCGEKKERGKLSKSVLLLQDNASAYKSRNIMQTMRDLRFKPTLFTRSAFV